MRNVDESHIDALRMQIVLLSEELADLEEEMKIMAYYGQRNMDRELFYWSNLTRKINGLKEELEELLEE